MANPTSHCFYDINTIANYDSSIIPFLAAPEGSAFAENFRVVDYHLAVMDWLLG